MYFPEWLYTIDVLFVIFILIFAFRGTRNGLSGELAHGVTLLALLAGFVFYYPQLTQFAAESWRILPPESLRFVVPAVMVLASVLLFVLLRVVFKLLIKRAMGDAAEKLAGGLIGMLRGAVIGLAVFAGLSLIPNDALYWTISEKSAAGGWVCNTVTPWLRSRSPELPTLPGIGGEEILDAARPVFLDEIH